MKRCLLIVIVCLGACVHRPPAVLIPTNVAADGAKTVSVLSVSTRKKSEVEGEIYSGERTEDGPSFAVVEISIPPTHKKGKLNWPGSRTPNPQTEFATKSVRLLKQGEGRDWYMSQKSGGRLFVFVHGYNVRYSDAVYRLAQIANDLGSGAAPVLFTWPSRGTLSSYFYDKESATFSRDALEQLFDHAVASPDVSEITILAHSMGTWLTMEALRQSAIRNGRVNPKIKDVILAAPDIDMNVFGQQFESLGQDRPHFTMVISSDDRALRLSSTLAGNIDRVGMVNLKDAELLERIKDVPGMTLIDLSELEVGGSMHHSKFADSAAAIEVIDDTFDDSRQDERPAKLASEAVSSVLITLSASMESSTKSLK